MKNFDFAAATQLMKAASGFNDTPRVERSVYDSLVKVEDAPIVFENIGSRRVPQLSPAAYQRAQEVITSSKSTSTRRAAQTLIRVATAIRNANRQSQDGVAEMTPGEAPHAHLTPVFIVRATESGPLPITEKSSTGWFETVICADGTILSHNDTKPFSVSNRRHFPAYKDLATAEEALSVYLQDHARQGRTWVKDAVIRVASNPDALTFANRVIRAFSQPRARR